MQDKGKTAGAANAAGTGVVGGTHTVWRRSRGRKGRIGRCRVAMAAVGGLSAFIELEEVFSRMMRDKAEGFSVSCSKELEVYGNLRCTCSRLICRLAAAMIEVRCSGCKRNVRIHTGGIDRIEFL